MFCPNCGSSVPDTATFCGSCGNQIARSSPAAFPAPVAPIPAAVSLPAMDYATWATRAAGYLIDGVLIGVAMMLLWLVLGSLLTGMAHGLGDNAAASMCCVSIMLFPLASLAVGIYNRVYLVSTRGCSIGQGVVHIKVVDGQGKFLTQGTALVRLLAQVAMGFVPMLPLLDLLWPLWDERRQTLHDKAVGCYVINDPGVAR